MPTARELLEQADALMRRNRPAAVPATSLPEVPEPVARHPAAPPDPAAPPVDAGPPIVGALPLPPAGAPAVEPEAVLPNAEASGDMPRVAADDADIPLLEDAVVADDDEFPVLTEAVDEIEVAAPAIDEGEPSDWLVQPVGDESVLGVSPPSVVLVPPTLPEVRAAPPSGSHVGHAPAQAVEPVPDIGDFHPEPVDTDVTIRRVEPVPARFDAPPAGDPIVVPDASDASDAVADAEADRSLPLPPVALVAPVVASIAGDGSEARSAQSPGIDGTSARADPPGQRDLPAGAEREALAEEIRMQVLQRIDMFTDTGLRERLGERLKPIVDRASADLVDAINQHVGEILRASVAEAIEREIDRWRSGR